MSGHAPVLILCPTSPSYLDFLPDLVNNYRTVYYYDAFCESQSDFLFGIAEKVLSAEEMIVARSYCDCHAEDCRITVLKKVLSDIALLQNDCLFFLSGLEKMTDAFDLSLLETLLTDSPDNLKIVFCSTTIPHIDYNLSSNSFPRIIICDKDGEALEFDGSVLKEGYFTDEQRSALYALSSLGAVHRDFAEWRCPGIGTAINALARNYRSVVLRLGEYYFFHPELNDFLSSFRPTDHDENKLKEEYVRFYYESGDYVASLEHSYNYGIPSYVEKSLEMLLLSGRETYVYSFFKANDPATFSFVPICLALERSRKKDHDGAFEAADRIENEKVKRILKFVFSLFCEKRKETFSAFCEDVARDFSEIETYSHYIYLFTYSEKKRIGSLPGFLQWADKNVLPNAVNIAFLHYMSHIYEANGNYASAKKYLVRIKELCDYYSYSHVQSWTFFFTMPIDTVATFAQDTSNSFLECCGYLYLNNKTQALSCLKNIKYNNDYSPDGMLGTALQGLLYGEAGDPDFGRSLLLLYAVSCEREKREDSSLFYISLAYCEWLLRNESRALICLKHGKKGYVDAFFSFLSLAIEIDCTMERDRAAIVDKKIEELLRISEKSCYENAFLVLQTCFSPILTYAVKHDICTEYVSHIRSLLSKRKLFVTGKKSIQIKFFGNTSVHIDRREISWKTKKCKELFLLYKFFPEGIERGKIIDEIWSDYVFASAVNNLKTTNNLIRKTLREYNVAFEFSYVNGKYKLSTDFSESDLDVFIGLSKEFGIVQDMRKKTIILNRMLAYMDEGFASDCEIKCFTKQNEKIKEEISVYLSALIKELIRADDYTNAKRFLLRLERIGYFDCEKLRSEVDKMVYKK